MKIFGASAKVKIQFEFGILELAETLTEILEIESFRVEPAEDFPHEVMGMAEALGFELWLEKISGCDTWYLLTLETSMPVQLNKEMHDLSDWLKWLLAVSGLKAAVTTAGK